MINLASFAIPSNISLKAIIRRNDDQYTEVRIYFKLSLCANTDIETGPKFTVRLFLSVDSKAGLF